ncbi:SPOR domain-containing protein [Propionivibrio dicarboxylicus]|uniref:Sporulation related domain-containing protein n=1 Tax=Propionivibrio dicarboxylicus TaxID=83767 RepID=A0A1G7V1T7_9RHOO|nr:SPOR domain-containing protein [Propionivibrio dicarboxylicus]SDG52930.1 Sporulation related domain-containing protein [Propionivibrio dicarboxylicus]
MRAAVFLLILANLMFFAWTQGLLGTGDNPDALRLSQQLLAERVTVVSRDEPPADASVKAVKAEKREPESCLLLGDLSAAELARVEALIHEKASALRVERSETASSGGFWVFIPPLPNKADAERKASELKRFKIQDFAIVQEPAAARFAISLGVFSSREAAESRLEELRTKGVRSAKVGERERSVSAALEVRGSEALLAAVRPLLAESGVPGAPTACRPGRTAAQ